MSISISEIIHVKVLAWMDDYCDKHRNDRNGKILTIPMTGEITYFINGLFCDIYEYHWWLRHLYGI